MKGEVVVAVVAVELLTSHGWPLHYQLEIIIAVVIRAGSAISGRNAGTKDKKVLEHC